MAAATTNAAADSATNAHTSRRDRSPAGSSRPAVRGFRASSSWSARRLKPMAALRAPTMATRIQTTCRREGAPPAARTAAAMAKGRAKTECESLIIRA
jgi:hypothetical protein